MTESTSPEATVCKRCGFTFDDGCAVRVSCGLETPALKKLRADAVAADGRLNQIARDAFSEDDIADLCGLDRHVRENASLVFVFIPREYWPDEAQAAWDARESAMRAFEAYGHDPVVPAHLRLAALSTWEGGQ
jgi:hypothetical protein